VNPREYDVVLHGATGFVGRLTARHLATHGSAAKVALSGRSKDRLLALREELGVDWPVIVTDAFDSRGLANLAASTTVIASTVGPYATYGQPLVGACVEAGTAYTDLTGEVLFVRDSVSTWHERARENGARIVHACGFDSVPSDLGVMLLHERVSTDGEGTLEQTALLVASMRGGVSGGTIASMRTQIAAVQADSCLRRVIADPYSLNPRVADTAPRSGERDITRAYRDPLLDRWVAPFVMAPFNSRIVRRSNALRDQAYGPGFRYREVMGVGAGPAAPLIATGVTAGLGLLYAGMSWAPSRRVLDRVLPQPGSGPSAGSQSRGHFRIEIHARTVTGAHYVATVAAQGDPGYAATAVMLGESALSLGLDHPTSPGGVLTPSVAMGGRLADRLRAQGFTMSVTRLS